MAALRDEQRIVAALVAIEGYSYKDAAAVLAVFEIHAGLLVSECEELQRIYQV